MAKSSTGANFVQGDCGIDGVAQELDGLKIILDAGKQNLVKTDNQAPAKVHVKETESADSLDIIHIGSEEDGKTFQLLELLNEYETLANDSLRVNFIQAYLDLSRANYHGLQRFNMDSVDMRPRDASTVVEWAQGTPRLSDKWQIYNEKVKAEKREKLEKLKELEKVDESYKQKDVAVSSARELGKGIRNRNGNHQQPETIENPTSVSEDANPPQDPVYQFGRMVPIQLRSAQTHFQKALADSVRLIRLQQDIELVVASLSS